MSKQFKQYLLIPLGSLFLFLVATHLLGAYLTANDFDGNILFRFAVYSGSLAMSLTLYLLLDKANNRQSA
jgi:hypothetical protein